MTRYRGIKRHRPAHPKIYVWSHTEKAEIEYFQAFKRYLKTPLLMPKKIICWTPQELLKKIIQWKQKNICDEDYDQIWCIFDIDDFFKRDKDGLMKAVQEASDNDIKIAYINECFELWILLHFQKVTAPLKRGKNIKTKIQKEFNKNKLGTFEKNNKIFEMLLPFQSNALKNAVSIVKNYKKINWEEVMSPKGNPSTSFHFLIKEIYKHCSIS